jgi:outer membrane biosynthesis protein TonB
VPQSLALKSPKFSVQPGDGPRLAGIGAALTFLLLFALLWNGSAVARKTTVPRGAELGLNIDHLGPALRLTWNPHHTLIENATHGVLWVVDGSARKKIDLNERQLAHGSAMYVPASDQVEFRLEVSGQGKPVANSIRSLTPVVQQQAPESEKPAPVPPEEEEEGAAPQKQSAPAQPAVATEEQHASVKPQAMNTTASVAPAALASENMATVAKVQPVPAPLVAKQESSRLFERQALPSVSFTYANDPILEQPKRKGIDKVPVLRLFHHHQNKPATVEEGMVPAKPIRAFKPHVPMDVARTLPGEWKVDLRARIDEKGRVSQLEPLSLDQDQRLVRVAMNAVNDWDFEPANIDGRGVNSGLIVTFHFHIPQQPDSERSASRH